MPETGPSLQSEIPLIAPDLIRLGAHLDMGRRYQEEHDHLQARLEASRDKISRNHERGAELTRKLRAKIESSTDMDDYAKLALLSAFGLYGFSEYASGVPAGSPATLYEAVLQESRSINSSLRMAARLTAKPAVPLLYFEAQGGQTYHGGQGVEYRPLAHRFFTARTAGSGLEPYRSPYGLEGVSFGIERPSAKSVPNFISGHLHEKAGTQVMTLTRPELVVATAGRARTVLGRSLESMQTNAVYIGEAAVAHATRFLLDKMVKIDCLVPSVFSKSKPLQWIDTTKSR